MSVMPVQWRESRLFIIDQTLLPVEYQEIELHTRSEVWQAIKSLQVRGAPAIGVCAAFGVIVGIREGDPPANTNELRDRVNTVADYLATSRPTAVNLFWALARMKQTAASSPPDDDAKTLMARLEAEAIEICSEDTRRCRSIGDHGSTLINDGDGVLTHCNAGALATSAYGTALAVMFRAHEMGKQFHVFADETRPLLQGARLTSWELMQAQIPVTLICDNMAAQVMREGRIQLVVVGADRIAANGAHGHLGFLSHFMHLLIQILAALFRQFRNQQADYLAIVGRVQPQIALLDGFFHQRERF